MMRKKDSNFYSIMCLKKEIYLRQITNNLVIPPFY